MHAGENSVDVHFTQPGAEAWECSDSTAGSMVPNSARVLSKQNVNLLS